MNIPELLCQEFHLKPTQCQNVIALIDDGNTIPFIARYRKEQTDSLDDQVLREIYERLLYLRGLDKRRAEIQSTLAEQGTLTEELAEKLAAAGTLAELEDIYRPFKPKRRTRATIAKEKGLEPWPQLLMQNLVRAPPGAGGTFVDEEKSVQNVEEALQGPGHFGGADQRRRGRPQGPEGPGWGTGVIEQKTKDEDSVKAVL